MIILNVLILVVAIIILCTVVYIFFLLRRTLVVDGELIESDLTPEQKTVLSNLNEHHKEILREFDNVLSKFDIPRQVYKFSLTKARDDAAFQRWCCCAYPPPDEAPCGDCPKKSVLTAVPSTGPVA